MDDIAPDPDTPSMFGDDRPADPPGGAYRVLALKYRPRRFEDLIGQEAMVRTLQNAFETGRIAHAFMLTGVRGVGKTTTARLLARALNYQSGGQGGPSVRLDPPGDFCAEIMASRHPDVLELDAASRTGVADMRDLLDSARYAPAEARYKVYIIDEVHMLSTSSFNALLKTLEEPPPHVKFIFATTEVRKVPVTVLSRCQRFDLKRLAPDRLAHHLARVAAAEGASVSEEGFALIARAAEGSVRDALSILDQAIVQARDGGAVTGEAVRDMLGLGDRGRLYDLFEHAVSARAKEAVSELMAQLEAGADPLVLLKDLLDICADVASVQVAGAEGLAPGPADWTRRSVALGEQLSPAQSSRYWQILLSGHEDAGRAPDPAVAARMVVLRLIAAAGLPSPEDAARIVAGLSTAGEGGTGGAVPSGGAGPTGAITRFEDIVERLRARREGLLLRETEHFIRPGPLSGHHLTCELDGGAPDGLLRRLAGFLEAETGAEWEIVRAGEVAERETLKARADRVRAERLARAGEHPAVQAALNALPGAVVVDVRQEAPLDRGQDADNVVDIDSHRKTAEGRAR